MFNKFKKNIYSQNGEDGIIEEILSRLKSKLDYTCCEFGAWDGIIFSNTYNLIKNKNYSALLIESNLKKFNELCNNIPDTKIIKLNKLINFDGANSLDNILENNGIKNQFDFLSIDIDGCDYYIFENLNKFKPKLICIEFNPTIPNDVEFVQKKNLKIKQGSSALSLINLSKKKNYTAVAATHCNLFFINNEFKEDIIGKNELSINSLVDDHKYKNYIFFGFDGTIHTSKDIILPWHLNLKKKKIKILPFFLNKFFGDYNFIEKLLLYLFIFFYNPKKYLTNPKHYLNLLFKKK